MRAILDAFEVGLKTAVMTACCLLPLWVAAVALLDADPEHVGVADQREAGPESMGDQDHGWISFTPVAASEPAAEAEPEPEPVVEEAAVEVADAATDDDGPASDDDGLADADPAAGVEVLRVPGGIGKPPGAAGLGPKVAVAKTRPTGATKSGGGGKSRKCLEPSPDIREVGDDSWEVERSLVDYYATHIRALDRLGYAAHHKNDEGKPDGFRVGGMRCGNALHQSGFRNGDVVHKVNGRKVNTIPQAIAAYFALRGKKDIEIELTRKGQRKVLRYRLVRS